MSTSILNRYIARNIVVAIFLVLLVLIGIEIVVEFTHEFSDIGNGLYGWLQACLYVPMMLPQDIYQLFPMAGLLGSLIGLGLLASHSELTVMRSSGMSIKRIVMVMIGVAFILTAFMVAVGEVLAPISQHTANVYKNRAISGGQSLVTRTGMWIRSSDDFIHVGVVNRDGKSMRSIIRYQFGKDRKLLLASFADKASYKNGEWTFFNVKQTTFLKDHVDSVDFAAQKWGVNFNPKLLGVVRVDTEQQSLPELYNYIQYRKQSGLDTEHYGLIFWQRIFQPISILVMLILAVPFIFGSLRSVTMGLRILVGVLVGFGFFALNQFIGPAAMVYHLSPLLSAALPSILFAIIAIILLARAR